MPTEPIAGNEPSPEVVDFLGRRSPLAFANQPALPSAPGTSPAAGPTGVGGLGTAPTRDASALAASTEGGGSDSAATILGLIGTGIGGGKTLAQAAKDITATPSSTPSLSDRLGPGTASSTGDVDPALVGELTRSGFLPSTTAPAGVFKDVPPSGPVNTDGGGSLLDLAGAGLSGASLATLVAQLAASGKISPGQAAGLLQSTGGTASSLATTGALGPEASGLLGLGGEIVGGAGAAASIGLSLADAFKAIHAGQDDPRQYSTAAGVGVGLGAGAIGGAFLGGPYGALIGAGAGGAAGDAVGQAIARNLPQTHYQAQREHWGEVATDAVNAYGFGIQKAASNGGLPEIQQALGQAYQDGHVQAYLTLPDAVAAAIGVPSVNGFGALSQEQFLMVLKAASQTDPGEWGRWITSSGDVPYLEAGRAQGVAQATQQTAGATLQALIEAYQPILAQMAPIAPEAIEASRVWAAGAADRERQQQEAAMLALPIPVPESGGGDA